MWTPHWPSSSRPPRSKQLPGPGMWGQDREGGERRGASSGEVCVALLFCLKDHRISRVSGNNYFLINNLGKVNSHFAGQQRVQVIYLMPKSVKSVKFL